MVKRVVWSRDNRYKDDNLGGLGVAFAIFPWEATNRQF